MASSKERRTPAEFFKKYFWEGQKLTASQSERLADLPKDAPFTQVLLTKHRRLLGVLIPFTFFQTVYWLLAYRYKFLHLFKERYVLSIVMIFGAIIGGMTTEGGGAVAFPVMTLAMKISPTVARDFSMMIQSCGLSAASFTIFFMSIIVEWHSIVFCTFGAIFGVVFGIEVIDPLMDPAQKKMAFVSAFFAFAIALFILNTEKKRITFDQIQNFSTLKAVVLVANGFVGGIFTGVVGSGVDICSFSILTLLFRISEKVATPTSVVLMATNSIVGFFWREKMQNGISQEAWDYFATCVVVVITFAPIGSLLSSHFHRLTLATMIYVLETVALISALIIVRPSAILLGVSVFSVICAFLFYFTISKVGRKMAALHFEKSSVNVLTEA